MTMTNNPRPENTPGDVERNGKIIRIILAFLVALAMWVYVDRQKPVEVTTSLRDVPVEFAGEDTTLADHNLMLLSGYDTTVDLRLKGPRKLLWELDKDEIRLVADTSVIQDTGIQSLTYQVVYPDNIPRGQIQVDWASIYSVTVTVGQLHTKEVPIRCDVTGKVADGFVSETLLLDPVKLVLRAQRDELLNVSYAKVSVNISGAKETVIQTVEYQLYDYNDIPIDNKNIRAATKLVQITVPVKLVKDVPLRVNFVEATGSTMAQVDYSIDPPTVRIKGDKALLDTIDDITLDTIYLQDLEAYQTLAYEVPVPEGTELVGDTTAATVTIVVEGVSERRITTSAFTCSGVPEGYEAQVVTESLTVNLRGLSGEINAMDNENLQVVAALTGITGEGSYTVPATVRVVGYSNVGIKGSYQVIVNVTVAAPPAADPGGPEAQSLETGPTAHTLPDGEQTNENQAQSA